MLRRLSTTEEFDEAVVLQHEVWGSEFSEVVPTGVLRVVQYVGGVVAGAFTDAGALAGFVFGVSGIRDDRLSHWSDTLAVRQEYRNRGIGEDLKCYQRDLLLPLGMTRVYWTFDPLESKNAYLNFSRLGVTAGEYRRDFYGATNSALHDGIGTDRLITVWEIASPRVARLLGGPPYERHMHDHLAGASRINEVVQRGGDVITLEPDITLTAPCLRLAIPADIQQLKARSPDIAREWRRVTRAAFETYFSRGYVARAVARVGEYSEYLLERDERR
ncbi:MAG: GNAT family N-acetyltransferase [Gemmatimonadota bacterium]|nr:GNAT family N-acetyltransferase [Gemmatimonadota bacterium]